MGLNMDLDSGRAEAETIPNDWPTHGPPASLHSGLLRFHHFTLYTFSNHVYL
jgi:hypothetical protein